MAHAVAGVSDDRRAQNIGMGDGAIERTWSPAGAEHAVLIARANARLIAASPELLEACKTALDALNDTDELQRYEHKDAIKQVETAIDKAEGTE